ncbi:hypothetical protein [Pengzhenrongella sp.]|uniref:hypothetical protein n=1 Tax=Pengzhenrongella sp. TaxID=2888820 RepID=UPI002F947DB5
MELTALAWMSQAPCAVPEQLRAVEFGAISWQAMILDGVARHVWGGLAIAADLTETPDIRASAVHDLVPPRGVVGRAAAAWVHAGGPLPGRIEVIVAPRARRPDPHPLRVPHESALTASDVVVVGPLRVTSVARTALDVARWSGPDDSGQLLESLVRCAGLDATHALGLLDALPGHPKTRAAREVMLALGGVRPAPGELSPGSSGSRRARCRPANR